MVDLLLRPRLPHFLTIAAGVLALASGAIEHVGAAQSTDAPRTVTDREVAQHSDKCSDIGSAPITDTSPTTFRGCSGEKPSRADAVRFLEQATFGPTPALIDHVQDI